MVRKIVKYGDPVLEKMCEPVTEFDTPELHELIADLWETMYSAKGVGLAAPQIGVPKQVAVIDTSVGENPDARVIIINPDIYSKEGKQTGEEGCLSIPGFREPVTRANSVKVRSLNVKGEEIEVEGQELLARALLHETDHLHGILFLQYLSALKRDMIRRKIRKLKQAGEWD
jgi:peptide deformylase